MPLEKRELINYYRQFLRYGDRALGFTGQKSRIYRVALRKRFVAAAPTRMRAAAAAAATEGSNSTATASQVGNTASADSLPGGGGPTRAQVENTLTFIRNAAATAATRQPSGGNFEYRLLRELLHNEYSYSLSANKSATTTMTTSSPLDPAAKPKKTRKSGAVGLASTRQIYRDLLDELNRTMNMCL